MSRSAKRLRRDSAVAETRVVDSSADFLLQIGSGNEVSDRRVVVSRRGNSDIMLRMFGHDSARSRERGNPLVCVIVSE